MEVSTLGEESKKARKQEEAGGGGFLFLRAPEMRIVRILGTVRVWEGTDFWGMLGT